MWGEKVTSKKITPKTPKYIPNVLGFFSLPPPPPSLFLYSVIRSPTWCQKVLSHPSLRTPWHFPGCSGWSAQALGGSGPTCSFRGALGGYQCQGGGRQATEPPAASPRLRAAEALASLITQQRATDRLQFSFRGLCKIGTRYLKEGWHANTSEMRWGSFCNFYF